MIPRTPGGHQMSTDTTTAPRQRIAAIDALRGFDMFWITGGRQILMGLIALVFGEVPESVRYQLGHPEWLGFSAWDMIMPLFLFITGAAMPFSLGVEKEQGVPLSKILLRMARRVALLWLLGTIAQGNLIQCLWAGDFERLRLYSNTLQAIASGYVLAGLGLLFLSKRGQGILCAVLLIVFWALMMFVPFGDHPAGTLEPQANLAKHMEPMLLAPFHERGTYTWTLSSLAFGGTVLLGVFAGHLLRSTLAPAEKLRWLVLAGVACLIGGQIWALHFPIIKHIWTSSMVLWAAGWSYLALALFYWLIDMRQWRKWSFVFMVVGANAILAYMVGERWVDLVESFLPENSTELQEGFASLFAFSTFWIFLYILYRKRIFVRV